MTFALLAAALTLTIPWQGRSRSYLLHVPDAPSGALVVAFHGGGLTAADQERISGFDAIADREHFIVAYPEGIDRIWSDGRKSTSAGRESVDDVGFAKAVVADIAKRHRVDPRRVFAAGFSNGGLMVQRLACDAGGTFAAIASVAGPLAADLIESCHPAVPVAVLSVHGVADPVVLFAGGNAGSRPGNGTVGSRATQEFWRARNGCAEAVDETVLAPAVADGTSVVRRRYGRCRDHADVVSFEITKGGHRWPPFHEPDPLEQTISRENGVSSANLSASEEIWKFFNSHARTLG